MSISRRNCYTLDVCPSEELINLQWNPDFSNLLGKSKLVRIIEVFEKSGVKLHCLTGEGKSVLIRIIGSFKKLRVREIGILL